jgi:hypothetical protein
MVVVEVTVVVLEVEAVVVTVVELSPQLPGLPALWPTPPPAKFPCPPPWPPPWPPPPRFRGVSLILVSREFHEGQVQPAS